MLLNRAETLLMNNPVRAAIQRHFEAARLLKLGGPLPGGTALEIGCGQGVGAELILDVFGADRVDAIDLDPAMVERARRRLAPRGDRVRVRTGDATKLDAPDASYDAVFDFGIVHHIPNWRDALGECHRVLVPGGRLYAEEVFERFLSQPITRRLLDHPRQDRFDFERFREGLRSAGFEVRASRDTWGLFGFFVADKR
jgi:ubiquinone/menaquinone biosynthesis C-methylase UbiE